MQLKESMATTTRSSNHRHHRHIAVVILCGNKVLDEATLGTIRHCADHFDPRQIYVVGYGQQAAYRQYNQSSIRKALNRHGLPQNINYTYRPTGLDKRKALQEVCLVRLIMFTHVLIVDVEQVDIMSQRKTTTADRFRGTANSSILLPKCAYYRYRAEAAPSCRTQSGRQIQRCWFFRRRQPSRSQHDGLVTPIFAKTHAKDNTHDRMIDVWERTALLAYLRNCLRFSPRLGRRGRQYQHEHVTSTLCTFPEALAASAPSRDDDICASPCVLHWQHARAVMYE